MSVESTLEASVEKSALKNVRLWLGISGLVAAIFGILILVWPGKTAEFVVALLAIYAIVVGIVYVVLGFASKRRTGWARVGHIALGVLFAIAGVVMLINLGAATAWMGLFLGVFIGVMWIIEGIVSLSTLRFAVSKGWTVFFAVVSIIGGLVLAFSPLYIALLWLMLGIVLVVQGIVQIVRAFTVGKNVTVDSGN